MTLLKPAIEESMETVESEELSSHSSNSSSSENDNGQTSKKKPSQIKLSKILPFQGKNRANMLLESVKAGFPHEVDEVSERFLLRETTKIPKKLESFDQDLFNSISKALMDVRASPEHESMQIFQKLTARKKTIKRSGTRALILMQEMINGKAGVHGTALVQEAVALGVTHNNTEGVYTFRQRFRATQTKLGESMPFTWGVETLRARLMHDIGDQNSCSRQLAEASFA